MLTCSTKAHPLATAFIGCSSITPAACIEIYRSRGGVICSILLTFSRNISSILVYVTPIWSLMKRAGNLAARATGKKVSLRQTPSQGEA
jgi:hypothetical protein